MEIQDGWAPTNSIRLCRDALSKLPDESAREFLELSPSHEIGDIDLSTIDRWRPEQLELVSTSIKESVMREARYLDNDDQWMIYVESVADALYRFDFSIWKMTGIELAASFACSPEELQLIADCRELVSSLSFHISVFNRVWFSQVSSRVRPWPASASAIVKLTADSNPYSRLAAVSVFRSLIVSLGAEIGRAATVDALANAVDPALALYSRLKTNAATPVQPQSSKNAHRTSPSGATNEIA